MNIPVLGIIENYSYVKCPDCGKEIKVFGESHVEEAAREMNVPVLGRMPIDMKLAEAVEMRSFTKRRIRIWQMSSYKNHPCAGKVYC